MSPAVKCFKLRISIVVAGALLVGGISVSERSVAASAAKPQIVGPSSVMVGEKITVKVVGLIPRDNVTFWVASKPSDKQSKRATTSEVSFAAKTEFVGETQLIAQVRRGPNRIVVRSPIVARATPAETKVESSVVGTPSTTVTVATGSRPTLDTTGMSSGAWLLPGNQIQLPQLPLTQSVTLAPDGNSVVTSYYTDGSVKWNFFDLRTGATGSLTESLPLPLPSIKVISVLFGPSSEIIGINSSSWPGYNRSVGVLIDRKTNKVSDPIDSFSLLSRDATTAVIKKNKDDYWVRLPTEERRVNDQPVGDPYTDSMEAKAMSADGNMVMFRRTTGVSTGTYVRNMLTGATKELEVSRPGVLSGRFGVALSGDGRTVLMQDSGNEVYAMEFVDVETGKVRGRREGVSLLVGFSFDGTKVLAVNMNKELVVVRDNGTIVPTGIPFAFRTQISDDFVTLYVDGVVKRLPPDSPIRK